MLSIPLPPLEVSEISEMTTDPAQQAQLAIALSLGLVFFISSVAKLRSLSDSVRAVVDYKVLPTPVARLYGHLLLLLINTALLIGVLRHIGFLYAVRDRSTLPPTNLTAGKAVPDLEVSTLDGSGVRLSQFANGLTSFVVVSPHCSGCHAALKRLGENGAASETAERTVIVSTGDSAGTMELIREAALPASVPVLIDGAGLTRNEWGVQVIPTTIVVDEALKFVRQDLGGVDPPQVAVASNA
ncbi:MAG TPA: redoxin domain-containing protein [Chloroflexota bacterium]|jgi:hypothetical protein|nr:redoxin domain-containing protein [Chloroflexota bacterium]